ncbi:hypothetical protein FDECE_6076 [Fusarium decemcellulare]|nr:hypothetical protein FDECE_6076 [Fusarium decemcellulare]
MKFITAVTAAPEPTENDPTKESSGSSDGRTKRFVQNTLDQMDSGELDWNLLVQDAVKLTSEAVVSIDLDNVVKTMLGKVADLARSFVKDITPIDQVLEVMLKVVKVLIAKVNLNTLIKMSITMMGSVIGLLDFDSAMRTIFEYVNSFV